VQFDLCKATGDGAKAARLKISQVLEKKSGFSIISNMAVILSGTVNIATMLGGAE